MTIHGIRVGLVLFASVLAARSSLPYEYRESTYARLLESYEAESGQSCHVGGSDGKCLFVWDCHKTEGKSLGLCRLDKGIYGSCCHHNESSNVVEDPTTLPPQIIIPDYAEGSGSVVTEGSGEVVEESEPTTTELPVTVIPTSPTGGSGGVANGVPPMETYPELSHCGISPPPAARNSPATRAEQFRIVGGENSLLGKWPWVVSIRRASLFGYSSTHSCGGVVINPNYIATAAHCVAALSKSLIRVRLGEFDFKDDNEEIPFIERKVEQKIIHPSYNYTSYENDLALLRLSKPVNLSATHISPLCLPKDLNETLAGVNGTIVGWGRVSESGQYSQKQQFVQVPILGNTECMNMFKLSGRDERIPDHFICAGFTQGGRDGCQGDSGGPLQVLGPDGRWFLVGIMSWGIGCGEPNQPGVYTRITIFTNWILEHAV